MASADLLPSFAAVAVHRSHHSECMCLCVIDSCEIGYWGNPMEVGGRCEMCECSGNIDMRDPLSCDQSTGQCLHCINHSDGEHCERCMSWYYGDAVNLKNCQRMYLTRFRLRSDLFCVELT